MNETAVPVEDQKTSAVVQIEEPPVDTSQGVEVDLDQKESSEKVVKTSEDTEKLEARVRAMETSHRAIARVNEKLQRENEQLKQQQPVAHQPPPLTDELDKKLFSNDPVQVKEALKEFTKQATQQALEQERIQQQAATSLQRRHNILEKSKQEVIQKYPELDPEHGDNESTVARSFSQAFSELLSEDPEFQYNPYGPKLAVERMERSLKSQANGAPAPRKSQGLPSSRPGIRPSNTVILTKEEKELCDRSNLDYAVYARTRKTLEAQGGIEA